MNPPWTPRLLAGLIFLLFAIPSSAQGNKNADALGLVVVRGKVSCADASGKQPEPPPDCTWPGARYRLEASTGRVYWFSSADTMTAMLGDPRVRERELQITARMSSSSELEIIRIRSIRDGRLYDVFYFCDVCNITAYAPGPCACCRRDYELMETPAQISHFGLRDGESTTDRPSPQP